MLVGQQLGSLSTIDEVENYGLVTPRGNAYDGVQAVSRPATDQYGFPAGGEAVRTMAIF